MYGIDLFSGFGGITLGLSQWVRPLAYCEIERYPQAILLSRMAEGKLPNAPIWDDVRTLDGKEFRGKVDIIYGGFPCQDISLAGRGAGLAGERSGLFFEVMRLAKEIQPIFIFLENVQGIRTRGLDTVIEELTKAGYDCRWTMLSAAEVGAPHKRERWFLLAKSTSERWQGQLRESGIAVGGRGEMQGEGSSQAGSLGRCSDVGSTLANANRTRLEVGLSECGNDAKELPSAIGGGGSNGESFRRDWPTDAGILRVSHGTKHRVERIRAIGGGVVPAQVEKAFKILMGLEH